MTWWQENNVTLRKNPTAKPMRHLPSIGAATLVLAIVAAAMALGGHGIAKTAPETVQPAATADRATQETSAALIAEGQKIFRFDTFGDEVVWTDTLHLNEVVE